VPAKAVYFQRKDGRWCAILSLGLEHGRRKRKAFRKYVLDAMRAMSHSHAIYRQSTVFSIA
jgi:hypothetical protein